MTYKSPVSVWISGELVTPQTIPVREYGGKKTGKAKKDGKRAAWSCLEDSIGIGFLKKRVHLIAVRFLVSIFFFRKKSSHMSFSALRGFVVRAGASGAAPSDSLPSWHL